MIQAYRPLISTQQYWIIDKLYSTYILKMVKNRMPYLPPDMMVSKAHFEDNRRQEGYK